MKNHSALNLHPQILNLKRSFTITSENLGKRFNREWIFKSLNFSFDAGKIYAITGANGSGKSTLLQVLWGQMPSTTGTVRYHDGSSEILPDEIFKYMTIATPYMELIDEFTLIEHLDFHFRLKKSREGMSIEEMIKRMNLFPSRDKFISNFSSGMRQRVKLALAFYTEASIIFLDEPGTNLDQQAFEWYVAELAALPDYCTIFIASNQPTEYPINAQKISIMDYK